MLHSCPSFKMELCSARSSCAMLILLILNSVAENSAQALSSTTVATNSAQSLESNSTSSNYKSEFDGLDPKSTSSVAVGQNSSSKISSILKDGGDATNLSTLLDFSAVQFFLDNVIGVNLNTIAGWPGWIHITILMTIFWTGHLVITSVVWLAWYYYVFGPEKYKEFFDWISSKKDRKKNKKPSSTYGTSYYGGDTGTDDSLFSGFFTTYSQLRRSNSDVTGAVTQLVQRVYDSLEQIVG